MKGSVKLPVFIDDARKYVNTTQLRAKYLGASYEAEYCQWQTLHGLGSLMETASLIITPNAYLEGKLIASYPPDPIGDFDVTRATTATRVNSAGLVELVPYNLLNYSQEFDNVAWDKANANGGSAPVITANYAISPDGTQNAYRIQLARTTATSSYSYVYQLRQSLGSGSYTFSVWMKSLSGTPSLSLVYDGTNYEGVVTLTNEWVRYEFTTTTNGNAQAGFLLFQQVPSTSLTADFLAYGFQMVEGTSALDYQKTETRLNIPRLDYSNGTCPSLLVEPQRTNLALYSSSFDTSPWIAVGTTITPNTQVAPDGTTTGDTYNTSQSILLLQTISASPSTTYTLSLWVKLGTATNICLVANNTAAWNTIGGQSFDGSDGLNTATWTRIEWTFATPASLPAGAINIHLGGNSETGLTQSTGSVYIWGAQLEAGNYSTSYIPTTSASVTRNADVISKTGISSLIGQTEGTIFAEFIHNGANITTTQSYFTISSGNNNNIITIGTYTNRINPTVRASNVSIFDVFAGPNPLTEGVHKIAIGYKSGDFAIYLDGASILTSAASATFGTMGQLDLGNSLSNNWQLGDGIKATALWKTRLTNDQLATLTTL